jgi:glucosamine-6-phosphate deaminase
MAEGWTRVFFCDRLRIEVYPDRESLGLAAAREAAQALAHATAKGDTAVIFAAAPSQNATLAALTESSGISWQRVTGLHMDEYVGLPADHPASFRRYLREHLAARVPLQAFHWIDADGSDVAAVCTAYQQQLRRLQPSLCLLGIGENGHLAFNDPGEARFDDPDDVRVVSLDRACREQQVAEGHFPDVEAVPRQAVTLTVPALMRTRHLVASVPGERKAEAVRRALFEPISEDCPASILRTHPQATLYLDKESAALIE